MDYRDYVRPKYVDLMQALGLECQFHRASGSKLFYRDAQGREVAVTDFLGGYGAALFGHNDPEFVDELCALLREETPFNAQMSVRAAAGELGRRLSEALNRELGSSEKFISTFSNSGAEAVEIAIKHAEYRRQKRLQKQFDEVDFELAQLAASERAYLELEVDGLDLPAGLLPEHVTLVTLRQLLEAVRQYNLALQYSEPVFVALRRSFHGKLVSSVQLTHGKQYRQPFARFGLNVEFVDPSQPQQLEELQARHRRAWLLPVWEDGRVQLRRQEFSAITAVLLEPIQGEGGINEFSADTFLALRRFANQQDCPLVVDEIQSGFGRTGSLLASSHYGLRGDYYCLSKALGGGLTKIAATVIRDSHYEADFSYIHSSTFAEDDLSCRIALRALERLSCDDGAMLREVREKGEYLKNSLLELQKFYPDVIADVRGRGLLLGFELHDLSASSSVVQASAQYNEALGYIVAGYLLQHERLRVAPSGSNANVIRLEPPACISFAEIDELTGALQRVCEMLRRRDAFPLAAGVCADQISEVPPRTDNFVMEQTFPKADKGTQVVARVAFINHLIDADMLSDVDPSLAPLTAEQKRTFIQRMAPERRTAPIGPVLIRSRLGTAVEFALYPLCMDSSAMAEYMASGDLETIREEIAGRIRDARSDGYSVAGLGMYTSIVTNNCQALKIPDVALTSGNALTIGMGLEAIEQGCVRQGIRLEQETAAVVGAAGNIASTYASLLSEKADHLLLIGSGREGSTRRLEKTAQLIYADAARSILAGRTAEDRLAARLQRLPGIDGLLETYGDSAELGARLFRFVEEQVGANAFITISNDLQLLRRARVVLCAANAPEAFLDAEHFAENAVICDIAVPLNVDQQLTGQRPDVLYMHGGIVQTPLGDGLQANVRAYLKEGQLYACMAESVLMGLSGMKQHYSYGDITREQVQRIRAIAACHGFGLAQFKTDNSF
ncbi:aminotransferase class III-fold pyridoxal phosphate-dependent enzyme [Pseudomonas sp. GCM10022188]|uniref:aminotransferase class III-fold pyridoxal phosphate-dependent enzyme n=1 Tax=Pseudomonas TaxID=286 RepID=UPI001E35F5F9|nr:aminotransferase class III-fold pyridoxal phosphate-dependent enzyme [Pseudomonas oryzagri]MCC6077436.1 aminotransferase class III-fold pyridoxal phosphate-dependent enzyme [Pseudomonas oryzagri]